MSSADSACLFGLFTGVAIGFVAGVLVMVRATRRPRVRLRPRHEYELKLAPSEFRSQR